MRAIDYIVEQMRKEAVIRTALKAGKKLRRNPFARKVIGKTAPAVKPTPVPTQPMIQSNTVPSVNRRPEPVRQGKVPNTREGSDMVRTRGETPVPAAPPVTGGIQAPVATAPVATAPVATAPVATAPVQAPVVNGQGTHKVNWTDQFRRWYEKDPLKTVAMTGGGLYLGKNIADKLIGNNKYGSLRLNKYVRKFIGK